MSDEDFRRLIAADPTQGQPDPDLSKVRARVLAEASGEVAAIRPRRRGLLLAGAAAASIALLAGGVLIGTSLERGALGEDIVALPGSDESFPAVNPEPVTSPALGAETGPMGPMGPGRSEIASADAASAMIWPGYQETLEPGADLTDESGTAAGYQLNGTDIDRTALARQLADVFEVSGTPRSEEGSVWVGSRDGTGPAVWVGSDAMVSWSYYDPNRNPWDCLNDRGVQDDVSPANPGGSQPCPDSPAPPSERDARDQARGILAAIGVGDAGAAETDIDWETTSDGVITTVTGWQTVEGTRTQLNWSVSFDGVGPLWANGFSAGLEQIPNYAIVGERTAVVRSQEPRWRAFGPTPAGDTVVALAEGVTVDGSMSNQSDASDGSVVSPQSPSATGQQPGSGSGTIPVQWDPAIAQSATLTLAQYWTPEGNFLLLPAYRYTTADDRGDWVIIAVADSAVNFGPFSGQ